MGLREIARGIGRVLLSALLWAVIAALLGAIAGNYAFARVVGKPNIAVVRVDTTLYPWTATSISKMLDYADSQDDIKAVVLEIDCPGGAAVSTEELYLSIVKLRGKKPVVAYINTVAASGGYYIAVAANDIYAKSSSTIGSVGAYVTLPEREELTENIIPTGPYKLTGSTIGDVINRLDMLKQTFVGAVASQRGERLKISIEDLSKAGIYSGVEALRYGLIDAIGPGKDAFERAADLAGIRNYGIVRVNEALKVESTPWYQSLQSPGTVSSELKGGALPVFYFQYIPPEMLP